MKYGIYIAKEGMNILKIGVITELELRKIQYKDSIKYLRWFFNSFDALAHKSLLDQLSFYDLENLISKHNNSK